MPYSKIDWERSVEQEIFFWDNWLLTKGDRWPDDYYERVRVRPLQGYLAELLPARESVRLLDVGSGPFTLLGTEVPGKQLELIACDALADEYNALLDKFKVEPLVRPVRCDAEELSSKFAGESFDLVHAQNCLDHSYDPVRAIREMVSLVPPGCYVYLAHYTNEAEFENHQGLHQWNFDCDTQGRFVIWNKDQRTDVANELRGVEVKAKVDRGQRWLQVSIRKLSS